MKRGAVVSDLHAGSIYGMLPAAFETFEGVTVLQNPGQDYLWKCWDDFTNRVHHHDPDFVIVNGDCVDGPQRKQNQSELKLVAPQDQTEAAIQTLSLLKQRVRPECKWYFTRGTPYHVDEFSGPEEAIAQAMGAERYQSLGTGRLCREVLWLEVEGIILEAAHHISASTGFYRMTALDREGQWSAMAAKDATKGIPKSDLLIRSHVHYFGHSEHSSKQIVTTPCWQLQTRFMRKNSTTRMLPDIGGLLLEIDGEAKSRGESACRVIKELYSLPPVQTTHL
jgi:hypothetical protein